MNCLGIFFLKILFDLKTIKLVLSLSRDCLDTRYFHAHDCLDTRYMVLSLSRVFLDTLSLYNVELIVSMQDK